MVCSASVDILHMGVPKMHVIDHKLFSGSSVGKVGAISCTGIRHPYLVMTLTTPAARITCENGPDLSLRFSNPAFNLLP